MASAAPAIGRGPAKQVRSIATCWPLGSATTRPPSTRCCANSAIPRPRRNARSTSRRAAAISPALRRSRTSSRAPPMRWVPPASVLPRRSWNRPARPATAPAARTGSAASLPSCAARWRKSPSRPRRRTRLPTSGLCGGRYLLRIERRIGAVLKIADLGDRAVEFDHHVAVRIDAVRHGELGLVDQLRRICQIAGHLVRTVALEHRDRPMADAPAVLQPGIGLIDAQIVLVPPEPCGDAARPGLPEPAVARQQVRIARSELAVHVARADLREGGEQLVV